MAKIAITVDDSRTIREMVSFCLKNAGFEVLTAEDGLDALDVLNGIKVDVIVTDINMPNMDGIELTKILRSDPIYESTPILVLTTEAGKKEEGRKAGATGWLIKPFEPDKLMAIVNKVCP